jgi:hypothetical protein
LEWILQIPRELKSGERKIGRKRRKIIGKIYFVISIINYVLEAIVFSRYIYVTHDIL